MGFVLFKFLQQPTATVLRIWDVYAGSEFFPSRIQDPHWKIFKYFNPNNRFLSPRKYDPGCSSRIRILIFYPSRIQGSKTAPPDPGSAIHTEQQKAGRTWWFFTLVSDANSWGRFWLSWRFSESRSFSNSLTFPSKSAVFSCSFLSESTSLSRSSSMDTISCSKLASSPNWDERCDMESSEIVGITSHIMFHIVICFLVAFKGTLPWECRSPCGVLFTREYVVCVVHVPHFCGAAPSEICFFIKGTLPWECRSLCVYYSQENMWFELFWRGQEGQSLLGPMLGFIIAPLLLLYLFCLRNSLK